MDYTGFFPRPAPQRFIQGPARAKEERMLAEFNIVPVGKGESMGDAIASVLKVVDASGLPYKANAMATIVEGGWDDIMGLLKKCHEEVMKNSPRVVTHIQLDIRPGKPQDRLTEKLRSVEKRLGREVKK